MRYFVTIMLVLLGLSVTGQEKEKVTSKYATAAHEQLIKEVGEAQKTYDAAVLKAIKKYHSILDRAIVHYTKKGDFDRAMLCKKMRDEVRLLVKEEDPSGFGKKRSVPEVAQTIAKSPKHVNRSKTAIKLVPAENGRWRNAGISEFTFKMENNGRIVFEESVKFDGEEMSYLIPSLSYDKIILELKSDKKFVAVRELEIVYGKSTVKTDRYKISVSEFYDERFSKDKMLDGVEASYWMSKGNAATIIIEK